MSAELIEVPRYGQVSRKIIDLGQKLLTTIKNSYLEPINATQQLMTHKRYSRSIAAILVTASYSLVSPSFWLTTVGFLNRDLLMVLGGVSAYGIEGWLRRNMRADDWEYWLDNPRYHYPLTQDFTELDPDVVSNAEDIERNAIFPGIYPPSTK